MTEASEQPTMCALASVLDHAHFSKADELAKHALRAFLFPRHAPDILLDADATNDPDTRIVASEKDSLA